MSLIALQNVWVEYPLFGAWNRSFTRSMMPQGRKNAGAAPANGRMITALRDVTLTIAAGERLAVLGSNGSGKTSLVRVLAGLVAPSRGSIRIDGQPSAILSLGCEVYPDATIFETIVLRGLLSGKSRRDSIVLAEKVIEFSELSKVSGQPIGALSSGLVFRLGIGLAIFLGSDIVLLDEVVDTADPNFVTKVKKQFLEKLMPNIVLVIVERSQAIMEDICTRAIILDNGQIVAAGSYREIAEISRGRYTY
ncbi:MAG: ATP-binding cassette domain-containing protein [Azospirillum sp.]|nr:ATP-binding cassette domain-containing protein [Azospirillum sp.]